VRPLQLHDAAHLGGALHVDDMRAVRDLHGRCVRV